MRSNFWPTISDDVKLELVGWIEPEAYPQTRTDTPMHLCCPALDVGLFARVVEREDFQ